MRTWKTSDLIWLAAFVGLGVFLVIVGYIFLHAWQHSTLRGWLW
jgi:hypothetical protein